MPQLADIVRLHGAAYLEKYAAAMPASHRQALEDILACRTSAMGGHVLECPHCGLRHHVYHSCKNRSCPKCQGEDTQQWIDKRRGELLGVPYFHAVFTLPSCLRPLARANQSVFYGAMMASAAKALTKLCADERYLGGQIGLLAVLHTWTRTLAYHPHVHCLVPAVALSKDAQVVFAPRSDFLVPVRALSKLMRGIFLEELERRLPETKIPRSARRDKWVVFVKPAVQGEQRVLDYLGRYVYRTAICNSRITSADERQVSFRYQDSGELCWKTLTVSGEEFLRRYLQHVLPSGFHKVRYYGLWAPAKRSVLRQIQLMKPPQIQWLDKGAKERASASCPRCLQGPMRLVELLAPQPHGLLACRAKPCKGRAPP